MTFGAPLTIQLLHPTEPRFARNITEHVDGIRWRSTAPGGFASCQVTLTQPISDIYPEYLQPITRLRVSDCRHGGIVWEGMLEDPGRTVTTTSGAWELTAVGGAGHATDYTFPVVYLDSSPRNWETAPDLPNKLSVRTDATRGGIPAMQLDPALNASWSAFEEVPALIYRGLEQSMQPIAVCEVEFEAGVASEPPQWETRLRASNGVNGTPVTGEASVFELDPVVLTGSSLPTFPNGWSDYRDTVYITIRRVDSGSNDQLFGSLWARYFRPAIMGYLHNPDGSRKENLSPYLQRTEQGVRALRGSDIVQDLLWRGLPLFDGQGADVEETPLNVTHMAYIDGATPEQILSDLIGMMDEPMYWAAWEGTDREIGVPGRFRFEFRRWPETISYQLDAEDGMQLPGSASEVYNAVVVRYREGDHTRWIKQINSGTILDEYGMRRQGMVDLGSQHGDVYSAMDAGNRFLAEHVEPPAQGSINVSRPVYDRDAGRLVQPWEIRPGKLLQIRSLPATDLMAPAGDTYRVVATEYSASDNTCRLDLDEAPMTTSAAVRDISRQVSHYRKP